MLFELDFNVKLPFLRLLQFPSDLKSTNFSYIFPVFNTFQVILLFITGTKLFHKNVSQGIVILPLFEKLAKLYFKQRNCIFLNLKITFFDLQ